MKKLLFLGACLVALASVPARAQKGESQVAVVTLNFSGALAGTGHLLVNRNGTVEDVTFAGATSLKSPSERNEALRKIVAQLTQEGYVLKSSFGTTDLIFIKEK